MEARITSEEFLIRQPSFPEKEESDLYYLRLANRLLKETSECTFCKCIHEAVAKRVVLTLIGYMQDIASDAGIWRSFVDANRQLYGWSVPFHPIPEEYIDYELNREDVRFLVWYAVAMLWEKMRGIYPHDPMLLEYADALYDIMDAEYEESPNPKGFNIAAGLELNDPEDRDAIYHLGNWLFLHSYLLTPAFSMQLAEMTAQLDMKDPESTSKLNSMLEEAMMNVPTGPLALYIPEWIYLVLNGKLPDEKKPETGMKHPYYEAFTRYTGGSEIAWFDSYEKMNEFFINALGWEKGEEHLAQAKGAHDYVLMVNPFKGMLMARNIARCVKDPENPYYDAGYAAEHAFDLLTMRGLCPGDLLHRILLNGWLPDARFPHTNDTRLVADNADFIARCYLQLYYRGD